MIIFSWIGSVLLLYSYWLVTQNKVTKNTFFLNFLGSILIIITAVTYQLWSVVFLNSIWTLCSLNGYYYHKNSNQTEEQIQPEFKFTFGKYKGSTIAQVLEVDPSYIVWAHYNVSNLPITEEEAFKAFQALGKKFKVKRNNQYNPEEGLDISFHEFSYHPEDWH